MNQEDIITALSGSGGDDRLGATSNLPRLVREQIWGQRTPITHWGDYTMKLERRRSLEDMPWMICSNDTVSQRMREFLEREAPGDLQYLPIKTTFRGKPVPEATYWVIKALRYLDCIDIAKSEYKTDEDEPGRYFFQRIVFELNNIPPNVMVFRAVHDEIPLYIRTELRDKIVAAGLTGCQFYPVNILDSILEDIEEEERQSKASLATPKVKAASNKQTRVSGKAKKPAAVKNKDFVDHWFDALSKVFRKVGPMKAAVVPLRMGGPVSLLQCDLPGTGIVAVTTDLYTQDKRDRAKKSKKGWYELAACLPPGVSGTTKTKALTAIRGVLTQIAQFALAHRLNPGETAEVEGLEDASPSIPLLLDELTVPAPLSIEDEAIFLMLCVPLHPDELKYLRKHGLKALKMRLTAAGVYPYFDLNRASVV